MKRFAVFTTAQIELGVVGAYGFVCKGFPGGPIIRSVIGEIPDPFLHDVNTAEFYALVVAHKRVSDHIDRELDGLPFSLVSISRNQNAIRWFTSPGKYIGRHAHKGDRISNAFKYAIDASIDPVVRTAGFHLKGHPFRRRSPDEDSIREVDRIPASFLRRWTFHKCEAELRQIRKYTEQHLHNLGGRSSKFL